AACETPRGFFRANAHRARSGSSQSLAKYSAGRSLSRSESAMRAQPDTTTELPPEAACRENIQIAPIRFSPVDYRLIPPANGAAVPAPNSRVPAKPDAGLHPLLFRG